ncbi:CHAT domain-containing protein [Dactylosporangium sp. CA-139066]|uniref:CHAT domain-containing protein n=1 Tax=Dactylosporangium sp. CA-139066 TaxID=3239930 RepID=UPI003D8AC239
MSEEPADVVARCAVAVIHARTSRGAARAAAVDNAVRELAGLPPGGPAGAVLAADIIRLLLRPEGPDLPRLRALEPLLARADRHPPDEPDWPRMHAAARLTALARAAAEMEIDDPRAALRRADDIAGELPHDALVQTLHRSTRMCLELLAGLQFGDEALIRDLPGQVEHLRGVARGNEEMLRLVDTLGTLSATLSASHRGDTGAVAEGIARLDGAGPVPGLPDFYDMDAVRAMLGAFTSTTDPVPAPGAPAAGRRAVAPEVLRRMAELPGASAGDRALHLAVLGGLTLRGGEETDPDRIDAAVADLRRSLALAEPADPRRPFYKASVAFGLWLKARADGYASGLDEAVELLEQARAEAGGPEDPAWSIINGALSEVHREHGSDRAAARRAGLDGLRAYASRVLLQADPLAARIAARDAARDAMDVAVRCLMDHAPADALRALDAGRGLMLFAATELRDPTRRLAEAGHHALAERWRAAQAGEPPPDLRREVIEVLARDAAVLESPGLEEIQAALRRLGADALVYLVPGDSGTARPGWAVIAPADDRPSYLALANLAVDDSVDVERYLHALTARDVEPEMPELHDSLDGLCAWAWKAAIGPLLRALPSAAGRVQRLVLVPMGDLARIPWQAARDPEGGYAVERVAISQTASARMLCDSAAAGPVRLTSAGLVVADPDTGGHAADLPAARLEAHAVHRAFYRGARYVGRLPDGTVSRSGPGSPDDVREWLRADDAEAGAVLHLASHGVMQAGRTVASSHLLLAGGERLTADELVGLLAANRRTVGLVVLAACHTGRSVHGYDEAYSLGTMFLAAGARTVLSTQWSVPDRATSLLMYMFHHHLMAERRPAWDALRRAQLWMLDPARRAPAGMPEPLRAMLRGPTDPARVTAWAGFIHWGQ